VRRLRRRGWKVLVLWECQLTDAERLTAQLKAFLASRPAANCSRSNSFIRAEPPGEVSR
jgi:G:T-mismatch repair DNA endonuclease (very short patch repair protein)